MIKKRLPILAVAFATLASVGCTNPETQAGYEGYVYHVPLMFGQMRFDRAMKGPATTGVSWRLFVTNIDMRKKSYEEDFQLLTSDNLSVSFQVVTRIKPKDGQVKAIVEEWGAEQWYEWNVKEPLRTTVRGEVIRISATDIQLRTQEVKSRIGEKLRAKYENTPFVIESVDIGEIQFPEEVTQAIQNKIAKKQELERQEYVLQKATKEAAIRVLGALKEAKQQRIISSTLDPLYVQRKAVRVYGELAKSPNKTIFMLPNSAKGTGLPLVLTEGKRKTLSAADERLLQTMETRYMKIAGAPAPEPEKKAAEPTEDKPEPTPGDEEGKKPAPDSAPTPAPEKGAAKPDKAPKKPAKAETKIQLGEGLE